MEIVLLILGAVLVVASFILPERKGSVVKLDTRKSEEAIKNFVEAQLKEAKHKVEEMAEETLSGAVDNVERTLERLTNEKIMAVNEYSDTVLKEINRNHEEVMFLYDMLNSKQESLKHTVSEITKSAKQAEETAKDAKLMVEDVRESAEGIKEAVIEQQENLEAIMKQQDNLETIAKQQVSVEEKLKELKQTLEELQIPESVQEPIEEIEPIQEVVPLSELESPQETEPIQETELIQEWIPPKAENEKRTVGQKKNPTDQNVTIQFAPGTEDVPNSNETILAMHKAGKSNMAIAKELGRGLGEVKLVIDLFEGK